MSTCSLTHRLTLVKTIRAYRQVLIDECQTPVYNSQGKPPCGVGRKGKTMSLQVGEQRLRVQGERVKMARAASGLSRDKFAKAVSRFLRKPISREIVRQIEIGERDAYMGELAAIAALTGKRVEWLAGGTNVPSDAELRQAPVAQLSQPRPHLRLVSGL